MMRSSQFFDLKLNKAVVLKGSLLHAKLSSSARGWASLVESMMRSAGPGSQFTGEEEPRNPAPTVHGVADELAKLSALRASGILTDEEFIRLKQRLIS